jgi:hypothetical protein
MIDWKEIAAEPDEGKTEEFGRQIFTIYQDVVTSNKPDGQLTTLELLALASRRKRLLLGGGCFGSQL